MKLANKIKHKIIVNELQVVFYQDFLNLAHKRQIKKALKQLKNECFLKEAIKDIYYLANIPFPYKMPFEILPDTEEIIKKYAIKNRIKLGVYGVEAERLLCLTTQYGFGYKFYTTGKTHSIYVLGQKIDFYHHDNLDIFDKTLGIVVSGLDFVNNIEFSFLNYGKIFKNL